MKRISFLFFLIAFLCESKAQYLEWANVPSNVSNNNPKGITVDTENNSYTIGRFDDLSNNSTVVKYNEQGDIVWRKPQNFSTYSIAAEEITCDLYTVFFAEGTIEIGDSIYNFPQNQSALVLLKTDSAFNIKWLRTISTNVNKPTGIDITSSKKSLVITFQVTSSFTFKNQIYTHTNEPNVQDGKVGIILKLDNTYSGSTNEWCTVTYGSPWGASMRKPYMDAEGNVYGICYAGPFDIHVNITKLAAETFMILKLSGVDGELMNSYKFKGLTSLNSFNVTPSGKLFVSGAMPKNFTYQGTTLTSSHNYACLNLFIDKDGSLIWAVKEESGQDKGQLSFRGSGYRNGFIYCIGGLSFGNTVLQGFPIDLEGASNKMVFAKFDTIGNVLWVLPFSDNGNWGSGSDLVVDYGGNPIFLGHFNNKIKVLGEEIVSPVVGSSTTSTLVAKISDFAIFRGNIYEGPYCAGDTIDIPYTKRGVFNKGNDFIAELSDDNGEFIGTQRELGRLSDTTAGVIKGVLPLFNVNTSGKYRIRILATNPSVQSYYRQDTLKLLVYSRDTANAGNDTLICYGQKIQLSTTGGSKWEWSPSASLDDSTLFKPIATPKTNTEYRIIISDSSGCGDTDTDYVWINVRKPLDIEYPFSDTTICKGREIKLFANGKGGDSTNYTISWYERSNVGDISLNTSSDNLSISNTQKAKTFFAVLEDGCTAEPDTQFYNISVFNNLKANFRVVNRRLEVDESITFQSISRNAAKYQWSFGNDSFEYGGVDTSTRFIKAGFKVIVLVAESDLGCKDTIYKTIRVFEKVFCAIPNAFTPNGDGYNNTFSPQCEGISNYTLTIYNRWGQVIFQQKNGAWDGNYMDKPVPEGVYMYKIHLFADNKDKSMIYGSVNVIR